MLKKLDIIQQYKYNISIILIGVSMVKFISATQAAAKWDYLIEELRFCVLREELQIPKKSVTRG